VYFGDVTPERVLARPNRSVSARTLTAIVVGLGVAMTLVVGFSVAHGNVFAPVFAVLHLAAVVWALATVWRKGDASDEVVCADGRVRVIQRRGAQVTAQDFHPLWVRLIEVKPQRRHAPHRILLGSHGQLIELGGFLTDEQRQALAGHVRTLIAGARAQLLDRNEHPIVASPIQS
jgi:uncharacterized membrane protein